MTAKQRIYLMAHLWPNAADAQGWRRDDRERRLEEASRALGRPIDSFNQVDTTRDVDKLFAHLGALAYNVKRAMDLTPAGKDYGDRRRLLYEIRREARQLGGEQYARAIARDQFHLTEGLTTLEDLKTDQLRKLRYTIHARASKRARENKNASLTSEECFEDQVVFDPEPEPADCPF